MCLCTVPYSVCLCIVFRSVRLSFVCRSGRANLFGFVWSCVVFGPVQFPCGLVHCGNSSVYVVFTLANITATCISLRLWMGCPFPIF